MKRRILVAAAVLPAVVLPHLLFGPGATAAVVSIAGVCLVLWLSELTPPFVPTLLLWVFIPVILFQFDEKYSIVNTLKWAADPILALFFGGFALGVATERHQLDRKMARWAFQISKGSYSVFLLTTILLTGFMSMWISNIAAAALMFACMRPTLSFLETGDAARRTLLIGVALGANLGGMATPIGTGPNAIAIASLTGRQPVTFIDWMTFALPLTVGMLFFGFVLLRWRAGKIEYKKWKTIADRKPEALPSSGSSAGSIRGQTGFLFVLAASAMLWLTEPFHGVPAAAVALAAAACLFLFGLLEKSDITRIDWSTLLLIAGGITLGRLFEASGVIEEAAGRIPFADLHPTLVLLVLCFASALLSALMSNTATAVLLIPLAASLISEPSTAILIAVSASFGMPFLISTPPNAMAYGEGGLRTSDLLFPGLIIMVVGCLVVTLTGKAVLNFAGIP